MFIRCSVSSVQNIWAIRFTDINNSANNIDKFLSYARLEQIFDI